MFVRHIFGLAAGAALAGCAGSQPAGPEWAGGEAPAIVAAMTETVVETDPAVDADDPALWADANDPGRAVMFATDKSDGLYVHDLDGSVRQFLPSGAVNNVDLRTDFPVDGRTDMVLVAATNDQHMGINLYLFDPDTLETRDFGFVTTDMGEPYGFCMGRRDDGFYLIANNKLGDIRIWRVRAEGAKPATELVRSLKLASQLEGCVVDDEADRLYVGEENAAIWRFDFAPGGSDEPTQIAAIDRQRITDDVEGLTIMRSGADTYLIASSQGDSTYPVFRIDGDETSYIGRFAIVPRGDIDGVTHTDGIDAWSGPIGAFPEGLIAVHDDVDAPNAGQQNYKLIDWREVKTALNLP